jgi:hypothetical protein
MDDQHTTSPIAEGNAELSVAQILARFPGPVTIRALTWSGALRAGLFLVGSMVAVALIAIGAQNARFVLWFGSAGVVGWLIGLFGCAKRLELDGVRFEVIAPFSYQSAEWRDVEAVEVRKTYVSRAGFKPLVHCLLNGKVPDHSSNDLVVDYGFMDRDVDGASLSVEDLARLMTGWRSRALDREAADGGHSKA